MKIFETLLAIALLCVSYGHADDTCQSHTWTNISSPSTFTELQISFPTTLPINIEYYSSTSDQIEFISSGIDNIILSLDTKDTSATSAAIKGVSASPIAILSVILSTLFLLPKSRMGLIVFISCLALCAPAIMAASSSSVSVRIGLPSQITLVCENSNCFAWPNTTSPTSSPTTSPSDPTLSPSDPTDPTDAPISTDAPTSYPTSSPTSSPTVPPDASIFFNLKVIIFYGGSKPNKTPLGADFAKLAFDSVGMPYDYVFVNSTLDLSTYLSTTGTGLYSGIVTVYNSGSDILTKAQHNVIVAYQKQYGVKWVIVGETKTVSSDISAYVTTGTKVTEEYFQVTFSSEFAQYGNFLNPTISVNTTDVINWSDYTDTPCALLPITITDTSVGTPVLLAHPSSGTTVAAAVFKLADGTEQFHYFLAQGADYIHSMAFASVMVNWISPGGLFIGNRRLTLSVQPDDLFLGSYIWDIATHSNPVTENSTWYRISADDLQALADFFDGYNAKLPAGSYLTVEWPTNFGGVNNSYYTRNEPDYLYFKAQELMDKFYYLSHTFNHPCTFDTLSSDDAYALMTTELQSNIQFAPGYFGSNVHLWSNNSMITPCVTGLYNPGAMRALKENGVYACVSDESVEKTEVDYEPLTPYHGVYSDATTNGQEGLYFVPRVTLDIDYCAMTPEMVVDEYMTLRTSEDAILDFEGIMKVQRMYGVGDKVAFRHDPYMLHQTNAYNFFYNDPVSGVGHNTSLVALFIERVVDRMMEYYNLPIVQHRMDDLVQIFERRQTMDTCGITTKLSLTSDKKIVAIEVTSENTCTMMLSGGVTLSGSTVEMETSGVETTAYISLTSNTPQTFVLSSPISL